MTVIHAAYPLYTYYVRPKMVGESSNNTHHLKRKQKGHSIPLNRIGGKLFSNKNKKNKEESLLLLLLLFYLSGIRLHFNHFLQPSKI